MLKLKLRYFKIGLAHPALFILVMLFLLAIPYLYPQHHFIYLKVLSNSQHLLALSGYALLIIIGIIIYSVPNFKIPKNMVREKIHVPVLVYQFSIIVIYTSLLMNALIVINAFLAYDNNFYSSKQSIQDFGGINIISQFYLFFIPPYLYHYLNKHGYIPKLLFVFGLVLLLRAAIMAERLAFLEFLIPVIISVAYIREYQVSLKTLLRYFLIFVAFFMILELTRQFYIQYIQRGSGEVDLFFAISWALERFFAYYADTQNKFYYLVWQGDSFTTMHFLEPFQRVITRVIDLDVKQTAHNFGEYNWKDFTNKGGSSMLYTDYGWLAPAFFTFFIALFINLWHRLNNGSLFSLCVYPNLVVAILEFPRFIILYETRFLIPFIFFICFYFIYRYISTVTLRLKQHSSA